jgi:hypothetical protein
MLMDDRIVITVSPLFIRLSDKRIEIGVEDSKREIRLRGFQHELLNVFLDSGSRDVVVLRAPTGAGKTLSLLIPLFANIEAGWRYNGAIGIYPSRELARDQMISIANFLRGMGARDLDIREVYDFLRGVDEDSLKAIGEYVRAFKLTKDLPVVLVYITSSSLEKMLEKLVRIGIKTKREILQRLWEGSAGSAYRIVFTVPEYPYLLTTGSYQDFHRAGVWLYRNMQELRIFLKILESGDQAKLEKWFKHLVSRIDRFRLSEEFATTRGFLADLAYIFLLFRAPIFFDEFHLYSGLSLASFISLFYIYMCDIKGIGKIVISSATPDYKVMVKGRKKNLLELVERLAKAMGYSFKLIPGNIADEILSTPFEEFNKMNEDVRRRYEQIRRETRIIIVPVILKGRNIKGAPAFGAVQREVAGLITKGGWLAKYREKGRGMIIVDRIASVIEIAKEVEKETGEKPLIVCSARELFPEYSGGGLRESRIVVGNMAIAFGIDLKDMDLGMVVAKDSPSVIQKIGRYGRGGGSDAAEIYLPIPFYKYRELESTLREIEGKKIPIPYMSGTSEIDLIRLIEDLYPRGSPNILLRKSIGLYKELLPTWIYSVASIIRERSEARERLYTAEKISDVEIINHFAVLVKELEEFFELGNAKKRLRGFIGARVNLTPLGLYNLYSYRSVTGVDIHRQAGTKTYRDKIDLVAAGRNIPLEYESGEFRVRDSKYEYSAIWIGIKDERDVEYARRILGNLDGYVVTLGLLIKLIESRGELYQGRNSICRITRLKDHPDLWDAPVFVVNGNNKKKFIEYFSAVGSMIPIYSVTSNGEQGDLLGGLLLL